MTTGRPTSLTPELIELAKSYLSNCDDRFDNETKKQIVNLPSIADLSIYLGVARSSIYKWKGENDEFSDILDHILSEQEKRLINKGLSGDYNSAIAKLALGKHGYSDKSETDITSKGEQIPIYAGKSTLNNGDIPRYTGNSKNISTKEEN